MVRILARACRLLVMLATISGIALTIFVALSAIMRYALGEPFSFTEELVGLLFSALVFLALPYVTVYRRHICITLLTGLFSPAWRRIADMAADLFIALYSVWFGYYAYQFAAFSFDLGSRSDLAGITLWPWMGLMAAASALMAIASVLLALRGSPPPEPQAAAELTDEY